MRVLLLTLILLFSFDLAAQEKSEESPLDVAQKDAAETRKQVRSLDFLDAISFEINKSLPRFISKNKKLISTSAAEAMLIYNYQLMNLSSGDFNNERFMATQNPAAKSEACSNPDLSFFWQNDVSINYYYTTSDGMNIGNVIVNSDDCLINNENSIQPTAGK